MAVSVCLRTVTGTVHELVLQTPVHVGQLYAQAAQALQLQPNSFKLVLKGSTITNSSTAAQAREAAGSISSSSTAVPSNGSNEGLTGLLRKRQGLEPVVPLSAGDVLLVMPQRKAPSERLQRAAAAAAGVELQDDEDAPLRFSIRPGAPRWEAWLARVLQDKFHAPELLLIWLFYVGPARLLVAAIVIAGARVAAVFELGPIYICLAIIITIFTHLGSKQEGEASAYSVFNPGVRRLPGQLDADDIDQQIRRGQM